MKDVAIKLVRKVSPRPPPSSPPAIGRPDTPNRQGALSLPCRGRYLRRVVLDRKGFGAKFVDLGGEGRIHSGNRQRVPDRALHTPPSLHKPRPSTMTLLLPEPPPQDAYHDSVLFLAQTLPGAVIAPAKPLSGPVLRPGGRSRIQLVKGARLTRAPSPTPHPAMKLRLRLSAISLLTHVRRLCAGGGRDAGRDRRGCQTQPHLGAEPQALPAPCTLHPTPHLPQPTHTNPRP